MIIVGDRYLQIPDPISSRLLRARWPRLLAPLLRLPAPMIDKSPLDLIFLASFLRRVSSTEMDSCGGVKS